MRSEAAFGAAAVRYASVDPGFLGAGRRTDGHGRREREWFADRPARFLASDLEIRDACSLSSSPCRRGWSWRRWVPKSIGDALVSGIGLAVDAVGVDLEQDRDAVPGAAGDPGRPHPEFSHSDTGLPLVEPSMLSVCNIASTLGACNIA